jgi:hypothetical protein
VHGGRALYSKLSLCASFRLLFLRGMRGARLLGLGACLNPAACGLLWPARGLCAGDPDAKAAVPARRAWDKQVRILERGDFAATVMCFALWMGWRGGARTKRG